MEIIVQTGGLMRHVGWEEGSRMLKDIGFAGVDWNLDAHVNRAAFKDGVLPKDHFFLHSPDEIKRNLDHQLQPMLAAGLEIRQAHAPFPPYMATMPELMDLSVRMYKSILPFCSQIGVKDIVVHGVPWFANDPNQPTFEDNWDLNMRLYEPLIPVLLECSTRVCLENLFCNHRGHLVEAVCSNVNQAQAMVDALNAKAGRDVFGFCVDTGHLNLLGKVQSQFIGQMGKRVTALHIHDNDGTRDEHLAPYTGCIDWDDFIKGLKIAGYRGDICFETFQQVAPERVSKDVVPVWLQAIYGIGEAFRKRLTEE